jgi:hypothetical protein
MGVALDPTTPAVDATGHHWPNQSPEDEAAGRLSEELRVVHEMQRSRARDAEVSCTR